MNMSKFCRFFDMLDGYVDSIDVSNGALMDFNRNVPYNNLPDLPPKVEIETGPVLKMAIRANSDLLIVKSNC